MNFFRTLFSKTNPTEDLIRNLAKSRIQNYPTQLTSGVTASDIDALESSQLIGLPEATIVTTTINYFGLRAEGYSREDALERINQHRSQFSEPFPSEVRNDDLCNYLFYVICTEQPDSEIMPAFIYVATRITCDSFNFDFGDCSAKK